jgi:hypothetical protein
MQQRFQVSDMLANGQIGPWIVVRRYAANRDD